MKDIYDDFCWKMYLLFLFFLLQNWSINWNWTWVPQGVESKKPNFGNSQETGYHDSGRTYKFEIGTAKIRFYRCFQPFEKTELLKPAWSGREKKKFRDFTPIRTKPVKKKSKIYSFLDWLVGVELYSEMWSFVFLSEI